MDLSEVEAILDSKGTEPFAVMEVLQDVQDTLRYIPEEAIVQISQRLDVPLIEVFRLANFYKAFSLKPRGRHMVTVCAGTACHVQGTPRLLDTILGVLNTKPGETTADGAFTVETVNCLGACALAPVVVIDGRYYDHMTPGKVQALIEDIRFDDALEEDEDEEEAQANA